MSSNSERTRQLERLANSLSKLPGVTGTGETQGGLRVYVDPQLFTETAKQSCLKEAGEVELEFAEIGKIRFLAGEGNP